MSQELKIIPRDENYVNPYKEETRKVILFSFKKFNNDYYLSTPSTTFKHLSI